MPSRTTHRVRHERHMPRNPFDPRYAAAMADYFHGERPSLWCEAPLIGEFIDRHFLGQQLSQTTLTIIREAIRLHFRRDVVLDVNWTTGELSVFDPDNLPKGYGARRPRPGQTVLPEGSPEPGPWWVTP